MKHLKLFSVLTHWHIAVRLIEVILKVTPHCDSLQERFLKHQVAVSQEQTAHQERNRTQQTLRPPSTIIRHNL